MGARNSRDSRSDSDDSSSGADSSSDDGGSNDGRKSSFWHRIATCLKPDGEELGFRTATDVKTSATPKKNIPLKALTVDNKSKHIEEYFDLGKKSIGEGGYARVVVGKDYRSGAEYAVKIITKSRVALDQRLRNEIDLMLSLDHPNIVKLFQTFEDQRAIYLVLELCAGGELFDKVVETGHLSEKISADIMQQVFRAVHYMHDTAHIAHRDLKPENFMFQNKGPLEGNTLKVIDFGIAATFKDSEEPRFGTKTGTPYYVAPEVLGRSPSYGPQVDLWSCGVIMYVLLSGRLPFKGMDENATLQKVQVGKFQFPAEAFSNVSKEAKELIRRLLTKSPTARATAEEALNDVWTKKVGPSPGSAPVQYNVINAIREFNTQNKMKKTALRLVARQLNEGAIANLRKLFTQLDKDGNGTLTVAELREGLKNACLPDKVIETIIEGVDSDKSGEIDYSEFIAATLERREYLTESACWAAFRVFDRDGDGRITKKELGDVLGSYELVQELNIQNHDVEDLMAEVDTNKDGVIDFGEFMQMMKR